MKLYKIKPFISTFYDNFSSPYITTTFNRRYFPQNNTHFNRNDSAAELQLVKEFAEANGAFRAVVCDHWSKGGAGALDLADAVIAACDQENSFKYLYPLNLTIQEKIKIIATEMYGAGNIEYTEDVLEKIKVFTEKVS